MIIILYCLNHLISVFSGLVVMGLTLKFGSGMFV